MGRASAGDMALAVDCVGRRLNMAARAARQVLEARLARAEMTFAGYLTLAELSRRGPVIQRQLARHLAIEGPTLTRQLERLERDGLVTRRRVFSDRRMAMVELTQAGETLLQRLQVIVADAAGELTDGLSAAQIEQLSALLDHFAGRMRGHDVSAAAV